MKDKKLILFLVVGAIVLIAAGILVLFSNKKTPVPQMAKAPQEEQIVVIKPEDIGLSLEAALGNRKLILEVANTGNISGLDYELSYTSKGDIPRGVIGHIDVKQPGNPVRQEITLGTCSDVCHYDEDVSDVKLILKVSKTDGTTSQVEQSLELK